MSTRSSVDIIEAFDRAMSRSTRRQIIQDVLESLRDENPYSSLVALHALSQKKEAESVLSKKTHDRIRYILSSSSSLPETQKAAMIYVEKHGLKEKDITGHLKSYDLFYKIMMDVERPFELRSIAVTCLIFWGASWLTEHPVDNIELLDFGQREKERQIVSADLAPAIGSWTKAYQDPRSGPKRVDAGLLLGIVDLEWGEDPLPLLGFLNSKKSEVDERGSELQERWLEKVIYRIEAMVDRFQEAVRHTAAGREGTKPASDQIPRLLHPSGEPGRSFTRVDRNSVFERTAFPDQRYAADYKYATGAWSHAYGDWIRSSSSQKR